jgi:hypothetical protein
MAIARAGPRIDARICNALQRRRIRDDENVTKINGPQGGGLSMWQPKKLQFAESNVR